MRKRGKEITPPPVESDFYAEALKAFDVVLPLTEEELEDLRRAEEAKSNRRKKRIRLALGAVAAIVILVLALWRPWENGSDPPVLGEPGVSSPFSVPIKISFGVYERPGDTDPSDAARIDLWEYHGGQSASLIKQLESLDWIHMPSISFSPAPAIGDMIINQGDGDRCIAFNSDGLIFAEGYMARPDDVLWNDIITLMQKKSQPMDNGRYGGKLSDGSALYLDVYQDGSFVVLQDLGIVYSGYWARVQNYLLLYTNDPKAGFCTLQVMENGGLDYLDAHAFWLLSELWGCEPLYPVSTATGENVTMSVNISWPGASVTNYGQTQITQVEYQKAVALLENAKWFDVVLSGYLPQMCGNMRLSFTQSNMTTVLEIQYSSDGYVSNGSRYAQLDREEWMTFVKLLSLAGSPELAFRSYTAVLNQDQILLEFIDTDQFAYWDTRTEEPGGITGNYLQLGDVVLLAGSNGMREILLWHRETGELTTQSGQVLEQIEIIYGDTYPIK